MTTITYYTSYTTVTYYTFTPADFSAITPVSNYHTFPRLSPIETSLVGLLLELLS
jgi:hypothetical protein